jgi:hypothetical protein
MVSTPARQASAYIVSWQVPKQFHGKCLYSFMASTYTSCTQGPTTANGAKHCGGSTVPTRPPTSLFQPPPPTHLPTHHFIYNQAYKAPRPRHPFNTLWHCWGSTMPTRPARSLFHPPPPTVKHTHHHTHASVGTPFGTVGAQKCPQDHRSHFFSPSPLHSHHSNHNQAYTSLHPRIH